MTELLELAGAEFRRRLVLVGVADWKRPSVNPGWTVRDLVDHVIGGERMAATILAGGTAVREEVTGDRVEEYDAAHAAAVAAFRAGGDLTQVVQHPVMPMPASMLLGFRVGDLTLHAWDLARSIGAEEDLDPRLVEAVWSGMSAMGEGLAASGMFGSGPSGTLPADAPLQQRLLDLSGRRA